MRQGFVLRLAAAVLVTCLATPAFATQYTWTGNGGDNNWNNPLNWTPNGFPTSADDATFSISPAPTAGNPASLFNSATLSIGQSVNIHGPTLSNTATLSIGGSSITGDTFLEISGNTTLSGAGTITLTDPTYSYFEIVTGTLLNSDNTIHGAGFVYDAGGTLTNDASILADGAGSTLTLQGFPITNNGTIAASNGGILSLNTTINNTSGTIEARGGSTVITASGIIDGGTRGTLGRGSIFTTSAATLKLQDTIENLGNLTVGGSSITGDAFLQNAGTQTTTLMGGGNVTLTDSTYSYLELFIGT